MLDKSPLSPLSFPSNLAAREPPGCVDFSLHRRGLRRASSPIPASRRRPSTSRTHECTSHHPTNLYVASTRPRTLHIIGNINTEHRHGLQQLRRTLLVVSDRASSSL